VSVPVRSSVSPLPDPQPSKSPLATRVCVCVYAQAFTCINSIISGLKGKQCHLFVQFYPPSCSFLMLIVKRYERTPFTLHTNTTHPALLVFRREASALADITTMESDGVSLGPLCAGTASEGCSHGASTHTCFLYLFI